MTIQEIKDICKLFCIRNYTINDDNSIDVNEDVRLMHYLNRKHTIEEIIPIKFRNINGNFNCSDLGLYNLKGSPEMVNGSFVCQHNMLTDLTGIPKNIKYDFRANFNEIRDIYNIGKIDNYISLAANPVYILVTYFINSEDNANWIEFFNDCDIIRDDHIIWDRLTFFYDYLDIYVDVDAWRRRIEKKYIIL